MQPLNSKNLNDNRSIRASPLTLTSPHFPAKSNSIGRASGNERKCSKAKAIMCDQEKMLKASMLSAKTYNHFYTSRRRPCQGKSRSQTLLLGSPWWNDLGLEQEKPCASSEHAGRALHTALSGRVGDGANMEHIITLLITFCNQLA
jgi:hypothetical protein